MHVDTPKISITEYTHSKKHRWKIRRKNVCEIAKYNNDLENNSYLLILVAFLLRSN